MQQLNNLDIIILIVVAISALIALSRGLVKEVLSIVGWVLATAAVIYLLPLLNPITSHYIETGWLAGAVTAIFILVTFLVFWILLTSSLIGKIRNSKLGGLDRVLGLFFGILRAFLLVILFYILINWMIPRERQADVLTQSKYFNIAGSFAKPIEELIPESTLKVIKEKARSIDDDAPRDAKMKEDKELKEKKARQASDDLFEKLAQPQIEKAKEKTKAKIKETFEGYNQSERGSLDRLIENTVE